MEDPEGEAVADAPVGDAVADPGAGVVETTAESYTPVTIEEALARARATDEPSPPDSEVRTETDGAKPADGAQPPGAEQQEPKPATQPQGSNVEADLDRIHDAIRTGRVEQLPANLKGRAQAIQRETLKAYQAEQTQNDQFRELFLQMEATRVEDPDAFHALMFDTNDPQAGQRREFYDEYRRQNPNVTLENPSPGTPAPTVEKAVSESRKEIFGDMNTALVDIARDAGLSAETVDKLRAGAQGPWTYLSSVFTEAVKAGIEKQLPKVREEERKAAEQQAQAKWAGKSIIIPRSLDRPVSGGGQRDSSKPLSMDEALAEARSRASA